MFTEKEIKKMPRKNVTKNEFLKLVKKLYPKKTFADSNFLPKNNGIVSIKIPIPAESCLFQIFLYQRAS